MLIKEERETVPLNFPQSDICYGVGNKPLQWGAFQEGPVRERVALKVLENADSLGPWTTGLIFASLWGFDGFQIRR